MNSRMSNKEAIGWAIFIFLMVAVSSGCSPLQKIANDQLQTLTVEQIQALDAAGQSVLLCITANGPPGNGSVNILSVPKTAQGTAKFSVDCHPDVNLNLQGAIK